MSEGYLGFEPSRIGALARCVIGAIEELDALWSADVLADDAIATARSISHTLSTTWMPVLVMLGADPSMREWDGVAMPAAPAPTAGLNAPGRATHSRTTLGAGEQAAVDEVVAACRALLDGDDDPADAMYELAALLAEHGDDATVMHAALVELGVDGFFDVLMTLGTIEPWEDAVATAEALRDGLRYVDAADGYGADALAAALVGRIRGEHVPTGTDPYSLADFVMESAHRPAGLGAAIAPRLVACEQQFAADDSAAPYGTPWYQGSSGSNLGATTTGPAWSLDPVAAALVDVAHDPAESRRLFADTDAARYLVRDRAYHDGYTAVMAFVAAACAGADVIDPDHPPAPALVHETNVFVTQAANWLAERPSFDAGDVSAEASASAADILVVHLLAASVAIERPPAALVLSEEYLADPALAQVSDESLGTDADVEIAMFGLQAVDRLTLMAATSDEGILRLRAGLNGFQQRRATGTVTLMLGETDPGLAQARLDQTLNESGHIEGYFLGTIGRYLEGRARAADARATLWITTAGSVAGLVVRRLPLVAFFATGVPAVQSWMRDELAHSSDAVAADLERQASEAASAVLYRYTSALVDAGLVELPAGWPGRALPPWSELSAVSPDLVDELWNSASDPAADHVVLNLDAVAEAVTLEQEAAYVRLAS